MMDLIIKLWIKQKLIELAWLAAFLGCFALAFFITFKG